MKPNFIKKQVRNFSKIFIVSVVTSIYNHLSKISTKEFFQYRSENIKLYLMQFLFTFAFVKMFCLLRQSILANSLF